MGNTDDAMERYKILIRQKSCLLHFKFPKVSPTIVSPVRMYRQRVFYATAS